jgi:hypothetical protein
MIITVAQRPLYETRPSLHAVDATSVLNPSSDPSEHFTENPGVSMDRSNTGLEFTSGSFKAQSFSRALI